jgi:hypothetical protein
MLLIREISEKDKLRFWSKVQVKGPDECWPWLGRYNRKVGSKYGPPYGEFWIQGGNITAHQVAYYLHKGLIPTGKIHTHTCDNSLCCNPSHIVPGTALSNARERVERGRNGQRKKTFFYAGEAWLIRKLWSKRKLAKITKTLLAKMFLCDIGSISNVLNNPHHFFTENPS